MGLEHVPCDRHAGIMRGILIDDVILKLFQNN